MDRRQLAYLVPIAALLVAVGCGETEPGGDAPAGGQDSGATAGNSSAGKAGETGSGATASGGSASGGSASGASSAGGRPGGSGGQSMGGRDPGDGGADSGPADGLFDCDARKIICKRAAPACGDFEVPSVEGTCYGECVKIDLCACSSADECPNENEYTCWMSTHCGPYVQ
jgi:hypothetical protein